MPRSRLKSMTSRRETTTTTRTAWPRFRLIQLPRPAAIKAQRAVRLVAQVAPLIPPLTVKPKWELKVKTISMAWHRSTLRLRLRRPYWPNLTLKSMLFPKSAKRAAALAAALAHHQAEARTLKLTAIAQIALPAPAALAKRLKSAPRATMMSMAWHRSTLRSRLRLLLPSSRRQ